MIFKIWPKTLGTYETYIILSEVPKGFDLVVATITIFKFLPINLGTFGPYI